MCCVPPPLSASILFTLRLPLRPRLSVGMGSLCFVSVVLGVVRAHASFPPPPPLSNIVSCGDGGSSGDFSIAPLFMHLA